MQSRVEDRRRAPRVDCRLPVRLRVGARTVFATTLDLSRIGVRLEISLEEIGLKVDHSLAEIGRQVTESLGDVVVASFHYELLGTLVSKGLRVVRVGRAKSGGDNVEVGCTLRTALTEEEVGFLGVDMPAIGECVDHESDQPQQQPLEEVTSAIVCATTGRGATPFCASYEELEDGMRLVVDDRRRIPVLVDREDAGSLLGALADSYGHEVFVVLLRGMRPFWSGRAALHAVDVNNGGASVALQLAPVTLAAAPAMTGAAANGAAD